MSHFGSAGKVELKEYDYDARQTISRGEVSLWLLAKNLKLEDLCYLLDEWVNVHGSSVYRTGEQMGQKFQETHRTLQGLLTNLCLSILVGLGRQELRFTDDRNRRAVEACQKLAQFIENGELPLQPFI